MLEIIYKKNGDIKAVCEWWMVNKWGYKDPTGEFVWIEDLEVTKSERNNGSIRAFIKIISDKVPSAKYGYFFRQRKYPGREQKTYTREQWLRRIKWAKINNQERQ